MEIKKTFKFLFVLLPFEFCLLNLSASAANAMENNNYTLENQSVEIQSYFAPTPKPIQKEPLEKPLASGENYYAQTNSASSFSFSISQDSLNFGELSATNPITRQLNLAIESSTACQIFAAENQPLMQNKIALPDTTCDSGVCTEITSSPWTSALAYGFGYHTENMAENEYMQFADLSKEEALAQLFEGKENKAEKNILYKINISGTQQPGAYANIVTYLAVPNY